MEPGTTTKDSTDGELFSRVSLIKLVLVTLIAGMLSSVAIALILSLSSRTTIVAHAGTGNSAEGILYYPPKPYFIVYPRADDSVRAQKQGLEWSDLKFDRIYLPDSDQPQRLSVTSSLADLKLGFTLHDGWMLTSLSVDSQSVADKVALTSNSLFNEARQLLNQARQLDRLQEGTQQGSAAQQEVLRQITAVGFALLELTRADTGLSLRVVPMNLSSSDAGGGNAERDPGRGNRPASGPGRPTE